MDAARRALRSDTGIVLPATPPLLCVDWRPETEGTPAEVVFVFDGGQPPEPGNPERAATANDMQMAAPPAWTDQLPEGLLRRLQACATAAETGRAAYLHHGRPP